MIRLNQYTRSRYSQIFFSVFSVTIVTIFAIWWFDPLHIPTNFGSTPTFLDIVIFLLVSYVLWHPIVMDVLTWCIASRIKSIRQQKPVPGLRVAFITTIVPANESLSLLDKCLPAMVNVKYPHDTWILDEGNSKEVKALCDKYDVKHFSRCGSRLYNAKIGKYVKKTKGGNHNAWYKAHGNQYDVVAQIDTDFVPRSDFLTKTLGYFRDPKVAFVGTPQIYGNTKDSLIARGAAEQQYSFYGSVLQGLSGMGMTLLIGANHVIRVSAFKDVDHYTAHITEDLITGMKLHANGWKSVYVPHPLAVGEGPNTWEAYFNQQLRWAYGCIDILFHHSLKYLRKMGVGQAIYYFFLQQHYFSGIAMALSICLLGLYFGFGLRAANVDTMKFLLFYSFVMLVCWLMSVWLQRFDVHRKSEGELLLVGKIISIAAWPVWFIGFISVLMGKRLTYKVTPKGEDGKNVRTPLRVFLPHFVFGVAAIVGLASSVFTHRQSPIMLFWTFSCIFLMLSVPFIDRIQAILSSLIKAAARYVLPKLSSAQAYAVASRQQFALRKRGSVPVAFVRVRPYDIIHDCLFLSSVVVLSFILYIHNIGFYSDDWSFLGNFTVSPDQSLLGLIKTATTPNTQMRPLQNIYDALLYWLFGTNALGYQLVNALVFLEIILLFYLILRRLKMPRIIAVAAPLVYALLPHYATDRFWYAAFQVNLSILFFFFSLFAGLRAFASRTSNAFAWKAVSLCSMVLCVLSYEVALPMVFINMVLFWNPFEKLRQRRNGKQASNHAVFIVLNGIVLIYLVLFKAMTTTRLGKFNYPGDIIHITTSVLQTNFGELGLKLPYIWGEILAKYATPSMLIVGGILYALIFVYLYVLSSTNPSEFPNSRWMRNLTFVSFIIFCSGYAIFFTNNKVGFSPTGIDNRVGIASAIGVACAFVGGVGWLSRRFLPEKLARWTFCVMISVISTGGFLMISTLASFWVKASAQQRIILTDIRKQFPAMEKGSTLILDGVCPYIGPGIVFESQWDLKGALQTMYHDPDLQADIVTPRLRVKNNGIYTQIYTFPSHYSFYRLFIYNVRVNQVYPIRNAQQAYSYFHTFNADYNNGCPEASAGNGVSVF
jgi:cellulose synthase/poly-beta-1,6-N-acetylglucosamine synthase-like glycosyltransferase